MGRSISCVGQRRRHSEMAAGQRRSRAGQYHLHPGFAGMRVSHHGLQLAGRQDPGCTAGPTR